MADDVSRHDEESVEHLVQLVRNLARAGQGFSITLGDMDGAKAAEGGARTRRFLAAAEGPCRKWVYLPGTGLVCVDPPA